MCEGPKDIFPVVTHVLGISKFESLCNLDVCHTFSFPKMVRRFLVYLIICQKCTLFLILLCCYFFKSKSKSKIKY